MKKTDILNRIFFVLLCVMLLVSLSLPAFAQGNRLVDQDLLLSNTEQTKLSQKLDSLSNSLGHDIAIVTVNDLGGRTVYGCADYTYDQMNLGLGQTRSGVLLLVCLSTREYALIFNGDADGIFSESDRDALEDAFVSKLSVGAYYDAFDAFADKCEKIIISDGKLSAVWIGIAIAVGIAVGAGTLIAMTAKHKSVKMQKTADSYMPRDSFRVDRSKDIYLYSNVTRIARPKNSSSGSSSRSSSRTRSGRSGRF